MEREYIKVNRPAFSFPNNTNLLRSLDDEFWKSWIFFHLLTFYKDYDRVELKQLINKEKAKKHSKIEDSIAKYIRNWLNNKCRDFYLNFRAFGENTNDEDIEGYYDITIHNTYWQNRDFHFECKNLNEKQDLINKYVYYDTYRPDFLKYDGGVYRYFNGKYSQGQNFGGLLGFVLEGDIEMIKTQIINKMRIPFNVTPQGDLLSIQENAILGNQFTFNSTHKRDNCNFLLHHILLQLDSIP
ncbi:hypothetical protein G7051_00525 [Dysgonomonas sp. HDW5B]|uniref:hypothetical protein n=1 Tax=Dysgonomonas sp. HDW5B TaxID=2714927 RepID=UPI00140DE2CD|nr:hypothetical protein [Dysgonomonas sp. HDW5B]QIK52910.1 hypothetical protein G7051_00525 [Dysgonomonas sp. HDW5B]